MLLSGYYSFCGFVPIELKLHFYLQEQVFTENDGFYAWMFLKRRTLWQTILSFIWPVFALAVCLFPVYPYQCKIVVLYSCAGALLFIVSLLLCKIPSLNLSHLQSSGFVVAVSPSSRVACIASYALKMHILRVAS